MGVLDSDLGLINGPAITKGTLIPPSMASHLPLLRGWLVAVLYFGLGGITGTAPLSEV